LNDKLLIINYALNCRNFILQWVNDKSMVGQHGLHPTATICSLQTIKESGIRCWNVFKCCYI